MESLKQLREAREAQITTKMQMQAMEIEREKREFEKIVQLQKEAFCREEKEREKKRRQAMQHRSEILKQVRRQYEIFTEKLKKKFNGFQDDRRREK